MDDLIERTDLGVPERGQRREFLALFVGFGVALLDFGDAAGFDVVGSDFVNHARSSRGLLV